VKYILPFIIFIALTFGCSISPTEDLIQFNENLIITNENLMQTIESYEQIAARATLLVEHPPVERSTCQPCKDTEPPPTPAFCPTLSPQPTPSPKPTETPLVSKKEEAQAEFTYLIIEKLEA